MSDPRNQDPYSRRDNQRPSSRRRMPSHAQSYGPPNPLAEFPNPAIPRNPQPGFVDTGYQNTAQYRDFAQDPRYPNYIPTHGPGPASSAGYYPDGRYSSGDYRYLRSLPAHGLNPQYTHEEHYDHHARNPQQRYKQPHERHQRTERVPQYDRDRHFDYDQSFEHEQQYEDHYGGLHGEDSDDYEEGEEEEGEDEPATSRSIPTQPAHPDLVSTQGALDPRYVVQHPEYFVTGKVFSILWHENDGRSTNATHVSVGPLFRGKYGEAIYSTIRRMVVVRAFDQYSWCFSISTYGGRGLAKPGVDPSKHTIVYMSGTEPRLSPNEPLMPKEPLEVDPTRLDETLHLKSRLNFGKIYTVEHNVKVLPIGEIAKPSMPKFISYARTELAI